MNKKIFYAITVLTFIIFSAIIFLIPAKKDATFWTSYSFIGIAIVWIMVALTFVMKDNAILDSLFLKLPIAYHLMLYLVIVTVLNLLIIFLPTHNIKAANLANIVILGAHVILILLSLFTKNTISASESNVKQKIFYMKSALADVQAYEQNTTNLLVKKALKELEDTMKYSDPMSHESLVSLEQNIEYQLVTLGEYINYGNDDGAITCAKQINELFVQRNRKCKALK